MGKTLTMKELAELGGSDSVKFDLEGREIARFGELIDKLNELIGQNADRMQADHARSQAQLEVLSTLQKMIREQKGTKSTSVDLSPLRDVLLEISNNQHNEAVPYVFDIKRHEGGAMSQVVATPIPPTLQ